MSSSAEKTLYRKAALIFEELGFLMPQTDRGQEPLSSCSGACVGFKGPFSGCLVVLLSPQALSLLSSNMLGLENTPDETLEQDALREIANVICGNALPAVFGAKEQFQLDAPKIFTESDSFQVPSGYSLIAQVSVPFDCGQSDVALYAESKAASLLEACS
jgi:CheY-specific phosphatase CheX